MIKHPGLRLHCIADAYPPFLAELAGDLEEFGKLTPFDDLITDFEVDGSYARGVAELHSDLDINIATGTEKARQEAKARIKADPDQFRVAVQFLKSLWLKYGLRIEVALEHPTIKNVPVKRCFSLRQMTMFGTESKRMDIDPVTETAKERVVVRSGQPRLSQGHEDENGNWVEGFDPDAHDPSLAELSIWEKRQPLLQYGETPETAQMTP